MPGIVIRICVAVAIAAASGGVASEGRLVASAVTLLLDNQLLCEELAHARGVGSSRVSAVRRRLGRETLAIASEIVARVDPHHSAAGDLATGLRLQRRLCSSTLARGEVSALLTEMKAALSRLHELAPRTSEDRRRLLDHFLERQEQAVLAAIVSFDSTEAGGYAGSAAGGAEPTGEPEGDKAVRSALVEQRGGTETGDPLVENGTAMENAGRERGDSEPDSGALPTSEGDQASARRDGGAGTARLESPTARRQQWDPEPGELARRHRARQESLDALLAGWGPRMTRELRPLLEVRSHLANQLEEHSLEQLRQLCSRLGRAAKGVEYGLVLESPVRAARADLDRMLAAYVNAGRWCDEGRFSFAWMEIATADERWARVRSLLGLRDR